MNPCIGGEGLTVIDCGLPASEVVPDIPFAGAVEVTFRSPDPAIAGKCLVDIEFQSLRCVRIVNVEIKVVSEVAYIIAACDCVEVEHIRVCGRASHAEFGGSAVHCGSGLILRQCRLCSSQPCGANLPVASGPGRKESGT